jgi:hypothetical protein
VQSLPACASGRLEKFLKIYLHPRKSFEKYFSLLMELFPKNFAGQENLLF